MGLERRRDGTYAWHVFDDPNEPGRIIETSFLRSLLELKYRSARVTEADLFSLPQSGATSRDANGAL